MIDEDHACKRCKGTCQRQNEEGSDYCEFCSKEMLPILWAALEKIEQYPVHSEPVGGAMWMQDKARQALKEAMEI